MAVSAVSEVCLLLIPRRLGDMFLTVFLVHGTDLP